MTRWVNLAPGAPVPYHPSYEMKTVVSALLVLAIAPSVPYLVVESKDGGSVNGTVRLVGAPPALAPAPVTRNLETCGEQAAIASLDVGAGGEVTGAVVALVEAPFGKAFPKASPRLEIKGCAFVPHVQVLPVGAPIEIVNGDPFLHHVEGRLATETVFSVVLPVQGYRALRRVEEPGVVALRSAVGFSWMSGFIFLSPHPYAVVTDARGAYALKGVPPGEYTIRVWHELLGEKTASVLIEPRRAVVMDFTLASPSR